MIDAAVELKKMEVAILDYSSVKAKKKRRRSKNVLGVSSHEGI